jgi:hypothetical protein
MQSSSTPLLWKTDKRRHRQLTVLGITASVALVLLAAVYFDKGEDLFQVQCSKLSLIFSPTGDSLSNSNKIETSEKIELTSSLISGSIQYGRFFGNSILAESSDSSQVKSAESEQAFLISVTPRCDASVNVANVLDILHLDALDSAALQGKGYLPYKEKSWVGSQVI